MVLLVKVRAWLIKSQLTSTGWYLSMAIALRYLLQRENAKNRGEIKKMLNMIFLSDRKTGKLSEV